MSDNKFGSRRKKKSERKVEYPNPIAKSKGGRPTDFHDQELRKLSVKIPLETFLGMHEQIIQSGHRTYNQYVNAALKAYNSQLKGKEEK